jgi:hypothetical protein
MSEVVRDKTGLIVNSSSQNVKKALLKILTDEKMQGTFRENCRLTMMQFNLSRTVQSLKKSMKNLLNPIWRTSHGNMISVLQD